VIFAPDNRQALLTVAQMAAADRAAIAAGIAGTQLMAAAGNGVFEAIVNRFPPQPSVVLCGPGNNGGDGYVVAEKLRRAGWDVMVGALVERTALKGDAAWAAALWQGKTQILKDTSVLDGRTLVVDALFGAGLARPLEGVARQLVEAVEVRQLACVAVDVPSGVQGDTGHVLGVAPRCRLTVTFFRLKPGHLLLPGRALCGETVLVDIGTPAGALDAIGPNTWRNDPALWRSALPRRALDDHKYKRGHALIYGGPKLTGAARLAALAARRIGAGLATIAAPVAAAAIYRGGDAGTIVADCEFAADYDALLADRRFNSLVLGPGLGRSEGTGRLVAQALASAASMSNRCFVLDADALTQAGGSPEMGPKNAFFALLGKRCVLTPHEGEFSILFRDISSDLDKLEKGRRAARRSGAMVVLKGAATVIAAPDGQAVINANAPASLASAGSGDVLSGMIGGLLAQGMEPFAAACAGVWLHGEAGRMAGPNLIAEDLCVALKDVWKSL
jgi:NAD(P)H-hydrate epimerase